MNGSGISMGEGQIQAGLGVDLGRIASILAEYAAGLGVTARPGANSAPIPRGESGDAPVDVICATFGLSAFERDVLLLCGGVELDAECGASVAAIQQGAPVTFALALAALPEAHWSALLPTGPLRYWRLIELAPGTSLIGSALRIDERILHYLVGLQYIDERLAGIVEVPPAPEELTPPRRALVEEVAGIWRATGAGDPVPGIRLCGDSAAARRDVGATAAALASSPLLVAHSLDLPEEREPRQALLRLWEREALLLSGCRLLSIDGLDPSGRGGRVAEQIVAAATGPFILSTDAVWPLPDLRTFQLPS